MKKRLEISLLDEGFLVETIDRCVAYRDFPHFLRELVRHVLLLQCDYMNRVGDLDVARCLHEALESIPHSHELSPGMVDERKA